MSPKIAYFVYSEGVSSEPVKGAAGLANGQRLVIHGALAILRPAYIPGQFSFYVNVAFRGMNLTEPHSLRLEFGYEDNILAETPILPIVLNDSIEVSLPQEEAHVLTSVAFTNVIIAKPGWYWTKVYFDGGFLGKYEIPAREAKRDDSSAIQH